MDRLASSSVVYIDDRVESERWVRKQSENSSSSFEVPEESEDLKTNAEMFLDVFGKGIFSMLKIPW